ncbi:hypothetical protein GKC30_05365 [Pseudodesulfovibrio sp. F-1]|uniref:Uncharacterized protein n=1 Tax=Pseudodesulfovibrio alkaliphilus TaxID=2661613 RepID=A0A7K1KLX2_9BACT|nr:hypothetical protein [Pseudodesulfovibrio alkaliphilus]MUM77055.1 hypothetical protein [Pseudodesulfovibrio alkaliphilus]
MAFFRGIAYTQATFRLIYRPRWQQLAASPGEMMRVSGNGSGPFDFGGGNERRSDQFRRGRRPGQKVRGTLVKWVSESMAWVLIDGHHLLAHLQTRPPEGAQLLFLIVRLDPDIVLRELSGVPGTGNPVGDGIAAAKSFESARTLFENRLRRHATDLADTAILHRPARFISLLTGDDALFAAYTDALACANQINRLLAQEQGMISYQPWLTPRSRRQLTHLRRSGRSSNGLREVVMECETLALGLVRFEFLQKGTNIGYRVKLQRPAVAAPLKNLLRNMVPASSGVRSQCLGVTRLPANEHGGLLAALLFTNRT